MHLNKSPSVPGACHPCRSCSTCSHSTRKGEILQRPVACGSSTCITGAAQPLQQGARQSTGLATHAGTGTLAARQTRGMALCSDAGASAEGKQATRARTSRAWGHQLQHPAHGLPLFDCQILKIFFSPEASLSGGSTGAILTCTCGTCQADSTKG